MVQHTSKLRWLLVFLWTFGLAACTMAAPGGASAPSVDPGGAKTTIRFRVYDLGEKRDQAVRDSVAAFEAENPDIHVEIELPPWEGYWDKLQTEFAANTASLPDVTVNQVDWLIPGAARGMFVDLKPYMERDHLDLSGYFYPMEPEWGWKGGIYGGLMYGDGEAHYSKQGSAGESRARITA